MPRWLFKEEPSHYSFADLERDGSTKWEGVKNPLAGKYLRAVKRGDRIFLYHTGKEKAVVGEMRAKSAGDGVVTVVPVTRLKRPVTLAEIKAEKSLAKWELVRISRLSVMPVSDAIWKKIEAMAAGNSGRGA
jgi:predicted RNA-binding protein with PUA-like domain